MTHRIVAAFVLAAACSPLSAQETQDTFHVREIVVTATRIPMPREAVPAAITVLRGDELRARGITYVSDALQLVPGVSVVESGPVGGVTSLFLRGGESDYAKVLVDGVPLNAPGGGFDFGELTTDDVERIEILRGPSSVIYGSDAVTGVVQIITRKGAGRRASAALRAGSFGTYDAEASAGGAVGGVRGSIGAARHFTDGVLAFNNEFDSNVLNASAVVGREHGTQLIATTRFTDAEYHYPTDGSGAVTDRNAFQRTRRTTIGLEGIRAIGASTLHLLVSSNVQTGRTSDLPDDAADTLGFYAYTSDQHLERQGAQLFANVEVLPRTILTPGVSYEREEERSSDASLSEFGPSSGRFSAQRSTRAAYLQAVAAPASRITVTGGVRHENNDEFGANTTYRVGAALRASDAVRFRAALGTAFKEPSFIENFSTVYSRGNPDLRPERSRSWEAGVEASGRRGMVQATYFAQRFRDMIQYTFTTPTPDAPNYFNVAAARADGVELSAESGLGRHLTVRAGYTFLHTETTEAGFDEGPDATFVRGGRMLRRPAHTGTLTAAYRFDRGEVGATQLWSGDRIDLDFSQFPARRVTLPGYARTDLAGTLRLTPRRTGAYAALTLRIENVFDETHENIVGFFSRGRTVLVGVRGAAR